MSKVAVVYWSGTGNTEEMANIVLNGTRSAGAEATLYTASGFNSSMVNDYDGIAFGCPAMGAEVLEEDEFQPMWDSLVSELSGKKVAIFGSYDWGDGEWIRTWESQCKDANINLVVDFVMSNGAPTDDEKNSLENMGKKLV